MNEPTAVIDEIDAKIALMVARLKTLQNVDGGFKGFYCDDVASGVWSTAEIVHMTGKAIGSRDADWLKAAGDYLLTCQNPDGGWPFRKPGKSITDITAWCCLALSHFGPSDAIASGVRFILDARRNQGSLEEDAWGLSPREEDRVYSTWIASYSLHRLLTKLPECIPASLVTEAETALLESKRWLESVMNSDGGWAPTSGNARHITSTAVALLTLFMQGDDPATFRASYEFLKSGLSGGLWHPEDEIVVTQEGYELTQVWFTSALAFRAMIFFAELGIASIAEVDTIFCRILDLIHSDGSVSLSPGSSRNLVWTIPFMIDAIDKYKLFIKSKPKEYARFLESKAERQVRSRRQHMEGLLFSQFPYPVSVAFAAFQHELDHNRKFQLMLQFYEIAIKYAAIVGLSGYLLDKERNESINEFLADSLKRPSLGDWARLLEGLASNSVGFNKLLHPMTGSDLTKSARDYLTESSNKANLNQVLSRIVGLRNATTGHGAVRTLYEYKLLVEQEEGHMYSLCDRLGFLSRSNSFLVLASEYDEFGEGDRYKIRVFKGLNIADNDLETSNRLSEGQRETMVRYIYFQNSTNNTIVNLYPFLSYMFCEDCKREQFFFYNSVRSPSVVSYLSYSCAHTTDRENGTHFDKRFRASQVAW